MDFSALMLGMQKISAEKEAAEAEKAKNKPFEAPKAMNLDTSKNLAEINRQKNREQLSSRAKAKKDREIERAAGYYDKLRKKDDLKRQEMKKNRNRKHQKVKKPSPHDQA